MLEVKQLGIRYNATRVCDGISFALSKGEIGCLLGPSGCGKTSILRAICGFVPAASGTISIDSVEVSSAQTQTPVQQRNVGMVFQDYALFPHLTVAENVGFGLTQLPDQQQQARIIECLELVGLDTLANRMPHELSGGQQQRVALARALAPKPQILLLDEPFSSLDVALREVLANDVRTILKEEQITGLLVTHDQQEAFAVADVIGVLNQGSLHQWGDANALYNAPQTEFVAGFIGEGVMLAADEDSATSPALVRPEHVNVSSRGEWSGQVLTRQFRGSHFVYTVRLDSLFGAQRDIVGQGDLHTAFNVDDRVGVDINFDRAVTIP